LARAKWCGPEIYDVASRLVDSCLKRDGSLFSAERPVWALDLAEALDGRVGAPIEGEGTFVEKLERQLEGLDADPVQLAAELFYVQLLAESDSSGKTKTEQVNRVLGLAPGTTPMLEEQREALNAGGVARYGAGKSWRDAYMRFLVRFVIAWKSLGTDETERLLASPWSFRDLVDGLRSSTDALQANALLHLIFPETFEYMIAPGHRKRLIAAFAMAPGVSEAGDDVDRQIQAIRTAATDALGRNLELYSEPFHRVWNEDASPQWTEMVSWARRIYEREDFDRNERDYKLALADVARAAREALEGEAADWLGRVAAAFKDSQNNLTDWRAHDKFIDWCERHPDAARDTIVLLWQDEEVLAGLTRFLAALPTEAASGPGTRLSIATFLLLGKNPTGAPFFKWTPYTKLRHVLGLPPRPEAGLDPDGVFRPNEMAAKLGVDARRVRDFLRERFPREAEEHGADWVLTSEQARAVIDRVGGAEDADSTVAIYADWVELLEELLLRLLGIGVKVRDLLDAQGIVWWVTVAPPPKDWGDGDRRTLERFRGGEVEDGKPPTSGHKVSLPPATAELAAELHLPQEWLQQNIIDLLAEKNQLIFYGPPGTGKTFVAQRIGRHLAENGGHTRLVQFHPSYTYEDFFEGYRPVSTDGGDVAFELVPGALREIVGRARSHPDEPHLLIVDEINRGNVAKVFGELYFLLEYRSERIELQYSRDEPFDLPDNLFLIGTMNTADRSIALVDSALRRRFYFVGFVPNREPVKSVLRKWLERHELDPEPAALLDKLNETIGEEDFAIGPSYFMTPDGSQPRLERAWEHALKPLLEEHFYGAGRDVEVEFGLASLRRRLIEEADAETAEEPSESAD
jgi:DNA polymerase III delta prime subunit